MTAATAAVIFREKGKYFKMLLNLMNQCQIIHNKIDPVWKTNLLICAVPHQHLETTRYKNCSLGGVTDSKDTKMTSQHGDKM